MPDIVELEGKIVIVAIAWDGGILAWITLLIHLECTCKVLSSTNHGDRYIADEDCGFPFTAQGYYDLFDGMEMMADVKRYHCSNPYLPIRFIAGEDDPCTGGPKGLKDSMSRLEKAGYRSITCKVYPGMRHEILQEKAADAVSKEVADWILEKVVKVYG